MPINSVPVDQSAFTRMAVVSIEPKPEVKFDQATRQRTETGMQATDKDGVPKWTVEVVISQPSRFGGRTQSDLERVTVTCAEDPASQVQDGDKVVFDNLTVGVMAPEKDKESDKVFGGKLFWQATGVRIQSLAGKS